MKIFAETERLILREPLPTDMVKAGLTLVNPFDFREIPHVCYKITQHEFEAKRK